MSKRVDELAEEFRKKKGYKDSENFIDPYLQTAIIERKKSDAFRDGFKDGYEQAVKDCIEKLSNAGEVIHDKTGLCIASKEWADWLEKEMAGEE